MSELAGNVQSRGGRARIGIVGIRPRVERLCKTMRKTLLVAFLVSALEAAGHFAARKKSERENQTTKTNKQTNKKKGAQVEGPVHHATSP